MVTMKSLLIFSILALPAISFAAPSDDPVVATVNGKSIKKSTLDEMYKKNMLYVSDKLVSREKVLNDLINRELGIEKATKAGLSKDPLVSQKMNDVLYHAQVSKDLEGEFKKIKVTDGDVKSYYNKNKEYRTAHILFRVTANPEENEWKAAQEKSLEVYNALKKDPTKFAELANKFSQSSAAPTGGDIGFQPAVQLAPEYFRAINGKPVNFITTPVRSQFGYHIIKVLAVKDYKDINKSLYQKIVYDKKRDSVLAKYFADMRKAATIKIEKKYLK